MVKLIANKPGETAVGNAIHVAKITGTRGEDMPTISLAALTHQGGKLHIMPQADDVGGKTRKTQANAMHKEFTSYLPAEIKADAKDQEFRKFKKQHGDEKVAKKIGYPLKAGQLSVGHVR